MRLAIALMTAAAALTCAGAASAASAASVEIRDVAARVTVIPEDRSDIKVELLATNPRLPIEVTTAGAVTIVDGGLRHRIRDCHPRADRPSVFVRGVGRVDNDALPQVVIRTPRNVAVASSGAVFGAVGRAASLELRDSGCSAWTIADVAGQASIDESGAGSVRLGSTGRLDVRLSGAAEIHAVAARQGLDAQLSGAGGVSLEDIAGPMDARVSGLGHVRVRGGHAGLVRAAVSGVGGVDFGGSADNLEASISGLGGIHVNRVTGRVTKSVSGLGHVTVDQPRS